MRTPLVATVALVIALAACGRGAEELLDTAKLEELQQNRAHARQLYEEIVRRYPGTAEAREAEARLRELPPGD
jgi:TolA-binding protein